MAYLFDVFPPGEALIEIHSINLLDQLLSYIISNKNYKCSGEVRRARERERKRERERERVKRPLRCKTKLYKQTI